MAIKGLRRYGSAYPEVGRLHKGGPKQVKKVQGGKEREVYGEDLDYFRFTSDDPAVTAAFYAAYGEKPAEIEVSFPEQTVEAVWVTQYEEFRGAGGAGVMYHACDGEICYGWRNEDGSWTADPDQLLQRPCPYQDKAGSERGCKQTGRLRLILPALWKAGHIGVVTLVTHAWSDLAPLDTMLHQLYAVAVQQGQDGLYGLPAMLTREAIVVATPLAGGGRRRVKKHAVRLRNHREWAKSALERSRRRHLGITDSLPLVDGATGEILGETDSLEEVPFDDDDDAPFAPPEPVEAYDGWAASKEGIQRFAERCKALSATAADGTQFRVEGWDMLKRAFIIPEKHKGLNMFQAIHREETPMATALEHASFILEDLASAHDRA